jgi:hypothetical protein
MKKIFILLFVIIALLAFSCSGSNSKSAGDSSTDINSVSNAGIEFKEYEHNFGKVAEGEKIAYVFIFKNSGTSDLVITSASTTCGCTVPKYNVNPISPGKEGTLEVVFDTSGRSGMQTKTITVKSNASKPFVILKITAEVTDNIN